MLVSTKGKICSVYCASCYQVAGSGTDLEKSMGLLSFQSYPSAAVITSMIFKFALLITHGIKTEY